MKKIVILGMIIGCLLMASFDAVSAVDEMKTLIDDQNDVVDPFNPESGFVSRPNVDIWKLIYSRTGSMAEVKLQLVQGGKIQSSDSEDLTTMEFIGYEIYLRTSDAEYGIAYVAGECNVSVIIDSDYDWIDQVVCSGVGTDTLTVSFELLSSDETYLSMQGGAYEFSATGYYQDEVPNPLEVNAEGPNKGIRGESVNFSGSVDGGTPPYEWYWDFDDESISEEQNPTHSFEGTGVYEVYLLVTDASGNYGEDFRTIVISDSGTGNGGNGDQDNNQNGDADDSGLFLFVGIIVMISLIGVAAIVFILRR